MYHVQSSQWGEAHAAHAEYHVRCRHSHPCCISLPPLLPSFVAVTTADHLRFHILTAVRSDAGEQRPLAKSHISVSRVLDTRTPFRSCSTPRMPLLWRGRVLTRCGSLTTSSPPHKRDGARYRTSWIMTRFHIEFSVVSFLTQRDLEFWWV